MKKVSRVKRPRVEKKPADRFHHGNLREVSIAEAFRIVDAEGREALSVRALARRLGVSDPAIYRHHVSREELLVEVARRGLLGLFEAAFAAANDEEDRARALEAMGAAYVRYAAAHRGWFRLTFSADQQDAGLYSGETAAPLVAAAMRLEARLKESLAPFVDPREIDDHYRVYWALLHGLSALVVERVFRRVDSDDERETVARRAIALHVETLERAATRRAHRSPRAAPRA